MDLDFFSSSHNDDRPELGLRHLQSRYVIPYVLCVAAAVLITGLTISLRSRSIMVDRVKSEQLVAARTVSQAVGNIVDSAARFVESIAKSPLGKGADLADVRILLKSKVENEQMIDSLFLYGVDGKLLVSTQGKGEASRMLVSDRCFERARAGEPLCFTGVVRLEDGARRAYVFAPVFGDGGGVRRVLAGGIDLESKSFTSLVMGLNPGKKGFSYLVDGEGKIAISGDPSKENTISDASELAAVKAVLGGDMGSMVCRYGRAKMVASFDPVEPMGWGFIVQRPYREAVSGAGGSYTLIFLFLLIAGGGAAALGVMQTQGVTRFLFMLGGRMDAIARGHVNQEIAHGEAGGFAPLISAFNRMVDSLKVEKKEGARTLDDVRQIARFNQGILASIQDLFMVVDTWHSVVMCNDKAEAFIPAEVRPCAGKGIGALGPAWGQRRIADAARKAVESMQEISLSNVKFSVAGGGNAIYDFRIYPLTSDPGGAVIYGREVSEFVFKHEKVLDSERFFREVATDAGDALVVLDADGKIEWVNTAAGRMLACDGGPIGEKWASFLGMRAGEFFESLAGLDAEGARSVSIEAELKCGAGKQLSEITASKVRFGSGQTRTALSIREMDARRAAERAALAEKPHLEKRIKFLSSVIESLPDQLAVVGDKGQVLLVNSAFARLFEEQREVFIGKKFDTLCAAGPVMDMAQLDLKGVVRREITMRNLRGKTFHAEVLGAALRNANGNKGYVFSVREIGAQREAHARECRVLEARTRTRMARTVAERFETILENLNAEIRELGANIFAPETRETWEKVVGCYKDLSFAANSLMMYSVDNPVTLGACSIGEIVKETLATMDRKGMIPEHVEVAMHLGKDCPKLNADADLLKIAVWHLVQNAIQAASKNQDGGEIVVRALYADIEGVPSVLAEVLDNGPDFDADDLQRMFEPFYGTKPDGMGLGLTLARRSIVKHNGRIGIERIKGITRAGFSIPLDLTAAAIKIS